MNRSKLSKMIALFMAISIPLSMGGCMSKPASSSKVDTSVSMDANGKYKTPVTVTVGRSQGSTLKFSEGESWDNNVYTKSWLNELGIIVKNEWVVPDTQYEQKLNVAIASGDLPDVIVAPGKQFSNLVENDQTYDLTAVYEKYASPLTKEIMQQDKLGYNTAFRDGKMMGIPLVSSSMDACHMIWYRTDWAKKLGISEPKTMQEVLSMADSFTKKDPDANGKNDTIGMAITKSFISDGAFGTQGFFAGYHAYPKTWVKDASNALVYGSTLPETKLALKQLQDMYKSGLLDKEFGVKDGSKVGETVASGKVGLEFGAMWMPLAEMQKNIDNDPNADWKAIELVSIDNEKAVPRTSVSVSGYIIVNKNCKNPEAVIKVLNLFNEKNYGKTADNAYGTNKDGIQTSLYSPFIDAPVRKNLEAHNKILEALKVKDASALNSEEKGYYDKIVSFNSGDRKGWGMSRVFNTPSSYDVIGQYVKENNMLYDGFYGTPTATMIEKQSTLDKMEEEVFTKIVMGDSIDSFDKFVTDWKKLGGDQITKEVNDWSAKNK